MVLPTELTLLQGVAVARWAAWAWLAITTFLQRHDLDHRVTATICVLAALGFTVAYTTLLRERPARLLQPTTVLLELTLAWGLLVADGWVFRSGHSFVKGQNLAGNWPLIAALSASTAIGPWWGGGLAALVGSGRIVGGFMNGLRTWSGDRLVSTFTTMVFYGVAGIMWGLVTRRLREVESEVAMRRARDEVARTLHDGVLQTLALVERRTRASDPELAAVARTSDRELRAWLFHGGSDDASGKDGDDALDIESRLRRAADRVATLHDLVVTVSVVDDAEQPLTARARQWLGANRDHNADDVLRAIVAAATEALTNAAKHANATRVVVFGEVDEDGSVFVSVRDDGQGFDVAANNPSSANNTSSANNPSSADNTSSANNRRGIAHSIVSRMTDVGGRAEIVSTHTSGTEVRLWSK